jgi:hypothetical protein
MIPSAVSREDALLNTIATQNKNARIFWRCSSSGFKICQRGLKKFEVCDNWAEMQRAIWKSSPVSVDKN